MFKVTCWGKRFLAADTLCFMTVANRFILSFTCPEITHILPRNTIRFLLNELLALQTDISGSNMAITMRGEGLGLGELIWIHLLGFKATVLLGFLIYTSVTLTCSNNAWENFRISHLTIGTR